MPKKQRGHTSFPILRLPISVRKNRFAKSFIERTFRAQKSWHEEVKQAPQFQNVVLYRRAGENETMLGSHAFDGFREFGLGVFNDMPFVENAIEPVDILETTDIIPDNFVRGDDNVVFLQCWKETCTFFGATREHHWFQIFCVFQDFVVPVACEGGRAYDKRREVDGVGGF